MASTEDQPQKFPHVALYRAIEFFVKGFGSGWIRWAPGTWGSLVGLLFAYFMGNYSSAVDVQITASVLITILATITIHYYEKWSGTHDDGAVVIDEIAGMMITMIGVAITLPNLITGFFLFRFLDILKPFPIGWIDRTLPGVWGTLFDDILAGIFACFILHFVVYLMQI